jgi:limonene-1,2-epoxide hydrolase
VLVVAAAGSGAASAAHAAASPAQVVRAWSAALNANRNQAAALFAPNAEIVEGSSSVRLTSRKLAVEFNASLPCAGRIVALQGTKDAAVATFVLGHRPDHTCDGPGEKAAALFIVRNGKIVVWERVAVPKPKKKATGQTT